MSYLSQMIGLTVQNFVSAATGIALGRALDIGRSSAALRMRSAISGPTCPSRSFSRSSS